MRWINWPAAGLMALLATAAGGQRTSSGAQGPPPRPTLGQATIAAQTALLQRKALAQSAARFTVLLDPAHGGRDGGAVLPNADQGASLVLEKSTTLALAERLRAALLAHAVPAHMTRASDTTVSDAQRAAQAATVSGGVCISLHASAAGYGVHVFYPMPQFELPNHSFLDAWTATDVPPSMQSRPLAKALQAALNKAGFAAIIAPAAAPVISRERCPAVAIELAPWPQAAGVSPTDSAYQQQVADALAEGLAAWRESRRALDAVASAYARKSRP